jgi:hypothetical protein
MPDSVLTHPQRVMVERLLRDREQLLVLALEAISMVSDIDNEGAREWTAAAIETVARIAHYHAGEVSRA